MNNMNICRKKAKRNDYEENTVRPQRPLGAGEGCHFGGGTEGMSRIGKGKGKGKYICGKWLWTTWAKARNSIQQLCTECTSGADTNTNQNFSPERILKYHFGVSQVTSSSSWKWLVVWTMEFFVPGQWVTEVRWKPYPRLAQQHHGEWASGLCPPAHWPIFNRLLT